MAMAVTPIELRDLHTSLLKVYGEAKERIQVIDNELLPNAKSEAMTSALNAERTQLELDIVNATRQLMRYYVLHLSSTKEVDLVDQIRDDAGIGNNPYVNLALDFFDLSPEEIQEAIWHVRVTPAVGLTMDSEVLIRERIEFLHLPSINMD